MKFTDGRRHMKQIEFKSNDNVGDLSKTTKHTFDAAEMGSGQEFTWAGELSKEIGNFKSFDTSVIITETSGEERLIQQNYDIMDISMLSNPVNLKGAFGG